jgi:asparagine synthase (glutamine-hydrolysing)
MCGICGLSYSDRRFGDREILHVMNDAIQHRGPDSDGYYAAEGIGLAIRRLAIIDVKGGDQPISNEDDSIWVVLNGEIYNYPEMRDELERRGHHFKTKTDTECILHYYEDEGESCVKHFRGMFAFALWDTRRQRLLIARDRLGKKPVYYAVHNGELYFCSELSGLLQGLPYKPEVDLEAIDLYLGLQYVPEPRTVFKEIYKLPAAHMLTWENGAARVSRYWDYSYQPKLTGDEHELAAELRDRLREAVRMRLISEVPLGAHLSGGIDSSIVVALMAELSDAPVKTFSVGFDEQEFSELPYARAVAQKFGTEHHEFTLTYGDIPVTLEKISRHFGEPFGDASAIPLYHLSVLTRQYVTVALNGDGGDEDFAGYQRYRLDRLAKLYLRLPTSVTGRAVPWIASRLRDRSVRPTGQSLVNGLKRLEQLPAVDERASMLRWSSYFSASQRGALWKREQWERLCSDDAQALLIAEFDRAEGTFLDRTLYTDLHTYLPGDLLVKADRMTMAASLEGRSPFLDHELVEWTARVPDSLKIRGNVGKYLLKKAFKGDLPASVRSHGKQGFGIPLAAWFRGPLASWSRELLQAGGNPLQDWFNQSEIDTLIEEHASARVDHGKRLYALTMLAVWARDVAKGK